jgi:Lambda phage tail tube protein, TTP
MTSHAIRTQGTIIDREDPARPFLFLPIGEIIAWTGPGGKASLIDATTLASTVKRKLPGLLDEGTFAITVNFSSDDDGQEQLIADRLAQTLRHFRITFTDRGTAVFSAWVMEFKTSGKLDSKVEASITLEIDDVVDWTPASASRWVDGWPDVDPVADWDLESTLPGAVLAPAAAPAEAPAPAALVESLEGRQAANTAALERLKADLARLTRVAAE